MKCIQGRYRERSEKCMQAWRQRNKSCQLHRVSSIVFMNPNHVCPALWWDASIFSTMQYLCMLYLLLISAFSLALVPCAYTEMWAFLFYQRAMRQNGPWNPLKHLTVFILPCREFSHWKVNSLVTEKRDFFKAPLPLAPEFLRNLRLLGRRPSLQQIHENLIKKYGTHFLVSATLGGKQMVILKIQ